jgi:hypothetical protein
MAVLDPGERILDTATPPPIPEEFRDAPSSPAGASPDDSSSASPSPPNLADVVGGDAASDQAIIGQTTAALEAKTQADARIGDITSKRLEADSAEMARFRNAEVFEMGNMPKPWSADQQREKYTTGPMEKFGSAAMIFAGIASAFSKQPAISALNAGAAVLHAINEGDEKAYNSAYTAWKDNTNLSIKRFDMQHKLFEDTGKLFDTDITRWKTESTINAAKYSDQQSLAMLANGQYPQLMDLQAKRQKLRNDMQEYQEHMEAYNLRRQAQQASFSEIDEALGTAGMEKKQFEELTPEQRKAFQLSVETKQLSQQMITNGKPGTIEYDLANAMVEFSKENKRKPNTEEIAKMKQALERQYGRYGVTAGSEQTPEAKHRRADAIANYQEPPIVGSRSTYGSGADIMGEVYEINPQYDAKHYKALEGSQKTTGVADARALSNALNKQVESATALESFENTAIKNLDVLVNLAKKVDRTGVPVIEKWVRAGRQATGDADVSDFNLQWTLTTPEIARIITSPRLVGQLTDSARSEVSHAIQFGANAKQIEHARDLLIGDFKRRRDSTESEIKKIRKQLQEVGKKDKAEENTDDLGGWH